MIFLLFRGESDTRWRKSSTKLKERKLRAEVGKNFESEKVHTRKSRTSELAPSELVGRAHSLQKRRTGNSVGC